MMKNIFTKIKMVIIEKSKIFCLISSLKKGGYRLIGVLRGRVSDILYWTVRLFKGKFRVRDILYWVVFILGFITVYWWCVYNGGNFIASLTEDWWSPLEWLIICEVLINIIILVHIILIVLILKQKFNVKIITKSSVGFNRKYLNKYKLNKVENLINKDGEFNKYLSILIVINVIIIIFFVLLNVYVNIRLSSHLNGYIYDHVIFHVKEECILLFLLNSDIKYQNSIRSRLEKRLFSNSKIRNKKGDMMIVDYFGIIDSDGCIVSLDIIAPGSHITEYTYIIIHGGELGSNTFGTLVEVKANPNKTVAETDRSLSEESGLDKDNCNIVPYKSDPSNVAHNVSPIESSNESPNDSSNIATKGISLLCLVRSRLNTNTNTKKIFPNPNIRNFSNKPKQQPLKGRDGNITESPDLTEINKQIFFPLNHLQLQKYRYRKENLLTEKSTAYLNPNHPKKLRVNSNKTPSTKLHGLRVASSNIFDVTYGYLKTLLNCNYSNEKGLLLNFNQHIAYNFNSQNLLLRGAEPLLSNSLQIKTNENQSTNAVTFNSFQLEKAQVAKATENINKNININYSLNKPLLGLYPESNKNTQITSVANTHITEEPDATTILQGEIPQDLLVRLNRLNILKGVSGETGYNRKGNNRLIKYSYKLLFYFFKSMYCLISKPVFIFTPDKVVIQLQYFLNIPKFKVFKWYSIFKYKQIWHKWGTRINKNNKRFNRAGRTNRNRNKKVHWKVARTLIRLINKKTNVQNILFNLNKYNLFRVFSLKFKLICDILNNNFNKPVEFQLIRIHKPYLDSNILVNLLSLNIRNKKFRPNVKIAKLFQKRVVKNILDYKNKSVNFIPAYLSGIKIRIGGRLLRQVMIPKLTKKRFERGASSIGKVNFLDSASITKKNRKGSYTLKISSGQNFF